MEKEQITGQDIRKEAFRYISDKLNASTESGNWPSHRSDRIYLNAQVHVDAWDGLYPNQRGRSISVYLDTSSTQASPSEVIGTYISCLDNGETVIDTHQKSGEGSPYIKYKVEVGGGWARALETTVTKAYNDPKTGTEKKYVHTFKSPEAAMHVIRLAERRIEDLNPEDTKENAA